MKRLAIPVAVILLTGLAFWWFSPTKILKRRTAAFIDTANVPISMTKLGRSARGKHVSDYLADRIQVESPESLADEVGRDFTRDQAATLYSGVARYCNEISITDLEFQTVEIEGDAALIRFTADAIVDLPNRRPVDGLVTVNTIWKKIEGDWLLESFEWNEGPR